MTVSLRIPYFIKTMLVILTVITVIFLRFYKLGSVPQGLTKDEAYYGYDAYSILKTGKDIWGERLPLRFKSTGEYKLNLTYFMIPGISLFGLTEMTVRLPSAIFGIFTMYLLFLSLLELNVSANWSIILAVVFGLSPWSFGMSRLFFESNVGLFFITLSTYILILKNKQSQSSLLLASISLAVSAYLYGPYLYIGVFILFLALFTKKLKPKFLLTYLIALAPMLYSLSQGGALTRLTQEWSLKMPGIIMEIDQARANCYLSFNKNVSLTKVCYLFWNKPILIIKEISIVTLRLLAPNYLFFQSSNHYILPDSYGAYSIVVLPLYFLSMLGFTTIAQKKKEVISRINQLLLITLISTLVVAVAGRVEIYRNPVGLYTLFLVIATITYHYIYTILLKSKLLGMSLIIIFISIASFNTTKYLLEYFTSYTNFYPLTFSSDSKEVYKYLANYRDYDAIIDLKFHGPIYAAFYWKIDPAYFQKNIHWADPDPWGWINARKVANVYSTETTLNALLCKKAADPSKQLRTLIISDPEPRYSPYAVYATYDFTHALHLHDIYDIDLLYSNIDNKTICK